MSEEIVELIFDNHTVERLDKYLVNASSGISRSRIQSLIHDGFVLVDDDVADKPGQLLQFGQRIIMRLPSIMPTVLVPENIPLDVIFENSDVVVVNKPAGMVVHPAAGNWTGTLVNAILGSDIDLQGIGGEERPGIVHRLDRDTSGIILIAKNDHAHQWLQNQFKNRKVQKTYLVLVDGKPPTPTGRIEAPLGRDTHHRKKMAVVPIKKGREAITEYKTLESFRKHTLLEVHPHTGRTHQIRVHLNYIGCPIAGDKVYGHHRSTINLSRQFLHASRLAVLLPGKLEESQFEIALPQDLNDVLNTLRKQEK